MEKNRRTVLGRPAVETVEKAASVPMPGRKIV